MRFSDWETKGKPRGAWGWFRWQIEKGRVQGKRESGCRGIPVNMEVVFKMTQSASMIGGREGSPFSGYVFAVRHHLLFGFP